MAPAAFISTETDAYHHFPAEKVDPIDTTAAGDTFVGAYAVAIAKYRTKALSTNQILSAVKWANKCAAKTVEKTGAQRAIPWLNEVPPFELQDIAAEVDQVGYEGMGATPRISATPSLTTGSSRSTTPTFSDLSGAMSP